jgi:hypothetical protein
MKANVAGRESEATTRARCDVALHVRGEEYRLPGHAFAGCSRRRHLQLWRRRAVDLGVVIEYRTSAEVGAHADADLVVLADGNGSRNRAFLADRLDPRDGRRGSDPAPPRRGHDLRGARDAGRGGDSAARGTGRPRGDNDVDNSAAVTVVTGDCESGTPAAKR